MSLRTRLLFLVALATLVPALLLGARFFQNRAIEIDAALATLAMQARNVADDLDEKIQGTAQLHYGLARAGNLDSDDRADCSTFLSAVREEYQQYTGILTITPAGRLHCDSLMTNRELDLTDRHYFQKALIAATAVTLQPAVGRLTGISVLQIAYPARAGSGELKFVLLASFNLQKFADFHSIRLSRDVDILLVDKDGAVLASPSNPNWMKSTAGSIAGTDLFRLATDRTGKRAQEVTGIGGGKQFWAAGTPANRDAGIYVMVGTPRDGLVAAASKRLYQELAIVGIVALLLFAGVWTLAEVGIRRQVSRIAAMAKKLGAGDLGIRIASPFPGGELGRLMVELNAAAESLQHQHAAIDNLNRKLNDSQQEEARIKVFLDTVIEHIPHPVSVKVPPDQPRHSDGWQLKLVNKAYERFTGRPREELVGRSARELYVAEAADIITASDTAALDCNRTVVNREYSLVTHANGEARVVTSQRVAIRDGGGKAQYLLTVLEDVTDKRLAEQRISHMAHHDTLTQLPNRAAFNAFIAVTLEKATASDHPFSILSIDLNRFKETNDVYGHSAGDVLLQEVAQRLQKAAGGHFIARIGGDEFTLIVTGGAHPAAAHAVAEKLLAALVDDFTIEGKPVQIGLSIGGAVYPDDGTDANTLMINADAALYRAKA